MVRSVTEFEIYKVQRAVHQSRANIEIFLLFYVMISMEMFHESMQYTRDPQQSQSNHPQLFKVVQSPFVATYYEDCKTL